MRINSPAEDMVDGMTTVEILQRARYILGIGWTKWEGARGADGSQVKPESPLAQCFCIWGVFERLRPPGQQHVLTPHLLAWCAIVRETATVPAEWNDLPERTFADVMAAFDRAIAKQRRGETP